MGEKKINPLFNPTSDLKVTILIMYWHHIWIRKHQQIFGLTTKQLHQLQVIKKQQTEI